MFWKSAHFGMYMYTSCIMYTWYFLLKAQNQGEDDLPDPAYQNNFNKHQL